MSPSPMKLFQVFLSARNQKGRISPALTPLLARITPVKFYFSLGRRAEVEASDRLVLVVDSSEASIEVDLPPLKRKQQNFQ